MQTTKSGVRFGLVGTPSAQPAPTLIVLASTPQDTLGSDYFLQCGVALIPEGYLCVSLDLPGHGEDHRPDEPAELASWSYRVDAGEDLMGDFLRRAKAVLNHLIEKRITDPERIAVCGTSRGGFAALHLAAADPRIRCVVAMAPVTDLLQLDEFRNIKHPKPARSLSAINLAKKLADRGVWIVIGDQDRRVGTDSAVALARKLSQVAQEKQLPGQAELHVLPEPKGHTTPSGAPENGAAWITRQMQPKRSP